VAAYSDLTPEQRRRRNQSNAASVARYNAATYDKVTFRVRKDGGDGVTMETIRAAAQRDGLSVNAWIIDAVRDKV